ncbi:MAG: homoserine dehydrogenase [bacterium]
MKKNVAILGLGIVGSGVAQILLTKTQHFQTKLGFTPNLVKILEKFPEKFHQHNLDIALKADTIDEILNDKSIEVVAEVMGGTGFAYECIKKCLIAGKSVATSNKEVIAKHGIELEQLAQQNNVHLRIEGTVGGGIPIIETLENDLIANTIVAFKGIVNGTTNYIITKMQEENQSFNEALKKAQELGYAEADPTSDIEAFDTLYKLTILSRIAFGLAITPTELYREGITKLASTDFKAAEKLGQTIKLLAIGKRITENKFDIRCHPVMIPINHPIARVNDVYNALFVQGDNVGDVLMFGRGAGSLPTASAVTADIIRGLREKTIPQLNRSLSSNYDLQSTESIVGTFYLRIDSEDTERVNETLTAARIPIKTLFLQDNFIIVETDKTDEKSVQLVLQQLPQSSLFIRQEN